MELLYLQKLYNTVCTTHIRYFNDLINIVKIIFIGTHANFMIYYDPADHNKSMITYYNLHQSL